MSGTSHNLVPGQKVTHSELGEGVVLTIEHTGFVRVFFQSVGERQVSPESLSTASSWVQQVIDGLKPATQEAITRLWLAVEAERLPLMEGAATLTAAKVDLLPHQVVLVHRLSNANPRRFLIADEVGLGKTIEAALIVRELEFRGELERALIVVPAGLVDNWRRELNEVFNLDFEVFGAEGDVTDRKSNVFIKHHRLIASIDTLKRPARIKRLKEAPPWDLIVFDEAHHLSVYKNGNKVEKTNNFKLAEALRDRCRDLILMSATPHQGDNFRFWMLVRLLQPGLFQDEGDMVDNRHRLNAAVLRRTKADACATDGSPLFARRAVNTEAFQLNDEEKAFYDALNDYLREGYNAASAQGRNGQALGFVMTIFQKIAASSFAAVKLTLQRRLLMLTIQEAIERDEALDVDGRDQLHREALQLIMIMNDLPNDMVGRTQAEQILADSKLQLVKKRQAKLSEAFKVIGAQDTELAAASGEESIAALVSLAIPEERQKIRELLRQFPKGEETKTSVLVEALRQLWQVGKNEKVVIFATYLGSVDTIKRGIEATFPGRSAEVLKGGDHGAKLAAQRRFKRPDGPSVLVCTAAGREGINLQFAKVLFNYDLPWNPMDLEQRIGRIHRYGQRDTAQIYNLVAADTIEGKIFLMLEQKLEHIAKALGKVDDNGQIAEDFRSQILGQLSSRLSYDKLYQEALGDPTLQRTEHEIEVAMKNANLAQDVVFELFQDLDRFNLRDYREFDDKGKGMERLVDFCKQAAIFTGGDLQSAGEGLFVLKTKDGSVNFTTDRSTAIDSESLELLGLEHPVVEDWLNRSTSLPANQRALYVRTDSEQLNGILTIWQIIIHSSHGKVAQRTIPIGLNPSGERIKSLEQLIDRLQSLQPSLRIESNRQGAIALEGAGLQEILHRDLAHSGILQEGISYSSKLLGYYVCR
jgi:superfamily II DNA or RNA helicase